MRHLTLAAATALALAGTACTTRAAATAELGDTALHDYARKPWDKAAMMGQTVQLGRHHGVPVVAEFICGDVCPRYTVRIIHYDLPQGTSCDAVDGVEKTVGVPRAIALLQQTFCVPKVLVADTLYYQR